MCGPNIHCSVPYVAGFRSAGRLDLAAVPTAVAAWERKYEVVGFCFSPTLNSHHELDKEFLARYKQPQAAYVEHIGFVGMGIRPDTGELIGKPGGMALPWMFKKGVVADVERQARNVWDTHYPTLEKLGEWSMFAVKEIGDEESLSAAETRAMDEWEEGFSLLVHPRHKDAVINYACQAGMTAEERWGEGDAARKSWHGAFWRGITDHPNEYWRDRIAHPPVAVN